MVNRMGKDNQLYEVCQCGHFGGMSANGVHETHFQQGHGACKKCHCPQFTWVGFHDAHGNLLGNKETKRRNLLRKSVV